MESPAIAGDSPVGEILIVELSPTHRAHSMCIFVYGAVTLYRAPFQTLPLTHTLIQALASEPGPGQCCRDIKPNDLERSAIAGDSPVGVN